MKLDKLNSKIVELKYTELVPWRPGHILVGTDRLTAIPYTTESARDVAMTLGSSSIKPDTPEERLICAAIKTEAMILRMIYCSGGKI